MKLTKFAHSCVLIEENGVNVLLNPGVYSWKDDGVDISNLPEIHIVGITHKHPDHLGDEFVRALVQKFPNAVWLAPPDAIDALQQLGVANISSDSTDTIQVTVGDHAQVTPFGVQVQNAQFDILDKVTDPGDTHDFSATKDILLMPFHAPWGTTIYAVEKVLEMKPAYVLPVHDWMWVDEWRETCYDRFAEIFTKAGITFLRPINGVAIEVEE